MSYCPKCGQELEAKVKFCPKCGASLEEAVQPTSAKMLERRPPKGPDVLGFISAGVILILLATTYIQYPIEPSIIANYFQRMTNEKQFLKPDLVLFDPAIFFLSVCGVWGIILSALRVVVERSPRKALGDLIGGFFCFFIVFVLNNYAAGVFMARTALAYFVVGIGFVVVANGIIHSVLRERQ